MAGDTHQEGQADGARPAYFGIGCLTAAGGFAGGGMIAVLLAKIVGAVTRCAADSETGAPCHWGAYWLLGALIGMVLLPTMALWRLRRGRQRMQNFERG